MFPARLVMQTMTCIMASVQACMYAWLERMPVTGVDE